MYKWFNNFFFLKWEFCVTMNMCRIKNIPRWRRKHKNRNTMKKTQYFQHLLNLMTFVDRRRVVFCDKEKGIINWFEIQKIGRILRKTRLLPHKPWVSYVFLFMFDASSSSPLLSPIIYFLNIVRLFFRNQSI